MNSTGFPSTGGVEMVFGIVRDCQTSHHALSLSIHRILQCDFDMKMMGKVWEEISNNPLKIQSLQNKPKIFNKSLNQAKDLDQTPRSNYGPSDCGPSQQTESLVEGKLIMLQGTNLPW